MLAFILHSLAAAPSFGTLNLNISTHIHYSYYPSDSAPLIVLIGNLASSAHQLNFFGIGPESLQADLKTTANPASFNSFASLLFIDLPGKGFSQGTTNQIPITMYDTGLLVSKVIQQAIKQLNVSSDVYLLLQGPMIRILGGLYGIGEKLKGVISVSPWTEIYSLLKYYGVAGMDLKLFTNSQRVALETTAANCLRLMNNQNFIRAHQCYKSSLQFITQRAGSPNLFQIKLAKNKTSDYAKLESFMINWPNITLQNLSDIRFQQNAALWVNRTFTDLGRNQTKNMTYFFKDFTQVRLLVIGGGSDFISYSGSIKNWLDNQFDFIEKKVWKNSTYQTWKIDDVQVGEFKKVKQVWYYSIRGGSGLFLKDNCTQAAVAVRQWLDDTSRDDSSRYQ